MRIESGLLLCLVAACGGARPAAQAPASPAAGAEPAAATPMNAAVATAPAKPPADPAPANPAVTTAPATSAVTTAPAKPAVTAAPAKPAVAATPAHAPEPAVPGPCRGAALDLAKLAHDGTCAGSEKPQPLPADVTVAIEPALVTVRSGARAPATIVLTNHGATVARLVLDDACDELPQVATELLDTRGNRVDTAGDQCGMLEGCGRQTVSIELLPGGTARLPFEVDARNLIFDENCQKRRQGAVPPGTYDLGAYSTFGELHAKVRVRAR